MIELIRYNPSKISEIPTKPAILPGAELVSGYTNVLWVERFSGENEVTIEGPISADLFTKFPKGSFVSHIGTRDIQIIHTHLIEGSKQGTPVAKVVGNSIFSILAKRRYMDMLIPKYPGYTSKPENSELTEIIPIPNRQSNPKAIVNYLLYNLFDRSGNQNLNSLFDMKVFELDTPQAWVDEGILGFVNNDVDQTQITITSSMLAIITDVMHKLNVGAQIVRNYNQTNSVKNKVAIVTHGGANRTGDNGVHLRIGSNSIKRYSSVQSIKDRNNVAIVNTTHYVFRLDANNITIGDIGPFDVGVTNVDASIIDKDYESIEEAEANVLNIMALAKTYAESVLNEQNKETLVVEVDINSDNPEYEYRKHFNIGDIVSIDSSAFFDPQPMRVVEFVENQTSGKLESYPVLKSVSPNWKMNAHTPEEWDQKVWNT